MDKKAAVIDPVDGLANTDKDLLMQSRYISAIQNLIEEYNENNKTQRLKTIYTFVSTLLDTRKIEVNY
ncbi:MAG: hypothetical protein PHG19_11025 [Anaerotignum sp.]|nr:hypothetical protein [Anaerotignum sp.]